MGPMTRFLLSDSCWFVGVGALSNNSGTDRTENTSPLLLYPIVAVETRLFAKPLLNNGCCIFAYLAVVAQQRVYMPQYLILYFLLGQHCEPLTDIFYPCDERTFQRSTIHKILIFLFVPI
jgi:hypothetical protein